MFYKNVNVEQIMYILLLNLENVFSIDLLVAKFLHYIRTVLCIL